MHKAVGAPKTLSSRASENKATREWKEEAHKNVACAWREVAPELPQTFICIEIQFIKHVGN